MKLQVSLISNDHSIKKKFIEFIKKCSDLIEDCQFEVLPNGDESGQIIFVDEDVDCLNSVLEKRPNNTSKVYFLMSRSCDVLPKQFTEKKIDGVLGVPLRQVELLDKLFLCHKMILLKEVSSLNHSFNDLLMRLKENLELAERLQKKKFPVRFPELKGMEVLCRYNAGVRSGGNYFDLFHSGKMSPVSFVLTDCSSYGLSSMVLTVMIRMAMKLSKTNLESISSDVYKIVDEIKLVLGKKDQLSLLYGVICRKTYQLKVINFGASSLFYGSAQDGFSAISSPTQAIVQGASEESSQVSDVELKKSDRLILLSEGCVTSMGGEQNTIQTLNEYSQKEAKELLNEVVFSVKSKLKDESGKQKQDCTAVVFDLASGVVEIKKK